MKESEILRLANMTHPHKRTANLRRHALVCAICRHPDRAAIDHCILDWRSPSAIVSQYGLRSRNAVYRHAHATGLWTLRQLALSPLERLIEHVDEIRPTARIIIRAVRMYAGLQWDGNLSRPTAANPSNVAVRARRRGPRSSPHARYTPSVAITQTPANQRDARC